MLRNQISLATKIETVSKIRLFSQISIKENEKSATITLKSPKINTSLINDLYIHLKNIENRKNFVVLKGGNEGFSSGKDPDELNKTTILKHKIFYTGYLNATIHLMSTYKIPIITFINGVTHGEGAGLSSFSTYRVATETTQFSIPQVKAGFHSNAGATFFLNRLTQRKVGYYLALTGDTIYGADVFKLGLATHFCKSLNLPKLESQLENCTNNKDIDNILDDICEKDTPDLTLNPYIQNINNCFNADTIEDIITKLDEDGSVWSKETLHKLKQCPLISLKVTLKSLIENRSLELKDCLVNEAVISSQFYDDENSKLIDDKNEVTDEVIQRFFTTQKISSNDLQKELFNERIICLNK